MEGFLELFAADRALLVHVVLYFILSIALCAEHQVLACLDHDRLTCAHADATYHVLWQVIDIVGVFAGFRANA